MIPPRPSLEAVERNNMRQPAYALDAQRRKIVLRAMLEGCIHRGWIALAAHVRETHVHAVVETDARPEDVMTALKAYASRALNCAGIDAAARRCWTRHGSTRRLWSRERTDEAIGYVIDGQGDKMETFVNLGRC